MKMDVTLASTDRVLPADEGSLGFGKVFAPHMFVADHDQSRGWYNARVVPYGTLGLDPAASVFHYGQAMFEGLKAFRAPDDSVRTFRLHDHAQRMADGAGRLCMPAPPVELFEQAVNTLVDVDRAWVPRSRGTALYIRPALVATEAFLGVRPSRTHKFFIISSPVSAYYADAFSPVRIWVEQKMVRAARGGLGAVKAGANYAASLMAAEEAKARGYQQVLWLDAQQHQVLEEVGTMNLFVVMGKEVCTPTLGGSILAGITRDSVMKLLSGWGYNVAERDITLDELRAAQANGTLTEVFGTGTAAVIAPVGELTGRDFSWKMPGTTAGPLAQRLYDAITGIQSGTAEDALGWCKRVPARGQVNGADTHNGHAHA